MTPEERARDIVDRLGGEWVCNEDAMTAAIATAIREAEARGLERAIAVAWCPTTEWKGGEDWAAGYTDGQTASIAAIRAEKERTP